MFDCHIPYKPFANVSMLNSSGEKIAGPHPEMAILYLSLTVSDSQAVGCTTVFHILATASPLCW
jgi:hypothetical protein